MKKLFVCVTALLASVSIAFAGGIADIPWNESNIQTLRKFDKAAVVRLLSDLWDDSHPFSVPKASEIGEFTWADLAGDGRYELVMTLDVNGRAFFNALVIFRRDSSGRITSEEIRGWAFNDLEAIVRDLNGDGKDELIIPTKLVSHSTAETRTWPALYRLEKGKYVEASRDFPSFYVDEVLPRLKDEIEDTQRTVDRLATSENRLELQYRRSLQGKLADLITERNKVLRLIGRDPTAGLQDAREWMRSDNPALLQDAAVTFKDIGGHEDEARAAGEAFQHAYRRELDARRSRSGGN